MTRLDDIRRVAALGTVSVGMADVNYLLDLIDRLIAFGDSLDAASICRRFTMEPCIDRPEISEADYCATCSARMAWRERAKEDA